VLLSVHNYTMEDTMARVNVFMSDDLLKAVDAEAKQERTNRSALLQKAAEAYLQQAR